MWLPFRRTNHPKTTEAVMISKVAKGNNFLFITIKSLTIVAMQSKIATEIATTVRLLSKATLCTWNAYFSRIAGRNLLAPQNGWHDIEAQ